MNILLKRVLDRLVRTGNLKVTGPKGSTFVFGDGSGEPVHMHIKTRHAERAITFDPMLAVPESYMDGELDILEGGVLGLMRIAFQNMGSGGIDATWSKAIEGLRHAFRRLQQFNTAVALAPQCAAPLRSVGRLYGLFLDEDLQYSCAYFEQPDMTLDEAQAAKKRHIAAKLTLKPGQTRARHRLAAGAASAFISPRPLRRRRPGRDAVDRAASRRHRPGAWTQGLEEHVQFPAAGLPRINERFDRIVSVGMFEHVGVGHFDASSRRSRELLKPTTASCCCTRSAAPTGRGRPTPGSANTSSRAATSRPCRRCMPAIERAGLWSPTSRSCACTTPRRCMHWRDAFVANRDKAKALYDERFCRMWEFYLAGFGSRLPLAGPGDLPDPDRQEKRHAAGDP